MTYSDPNMPGIVTSWQRMLNFSPARFRVAIENRAECSAAYEAIANQPEKFIEYGPLLINRLFASDETYRLGEAMIAVCRQSDELIQIFVRKFLNRSKSCPYPDSFAWLVKSLGIESRRVAPSIVDDLLRGTYANNRNRIISCMVALGGAGKGLDHVADRLLELTHNKNEIIQGNAISTLGDIIARPDAVIPRLADLLESFREYDCDMNYGGRCNRVAKALSAFGPSAAIVLDKIMRHLITVPEFYWEEPELDDLTAVIDALDGAPYKSPIK